MAAPTSDEDPATSETFLGRLYRISAPACELVYVGSTKTTLATRLGRHRRDHRAFLKGDYHYVSSFDVLEYPGATIDLLEESEFHDMQQFREREAYWIQRLPSCNRATPGRSARLSTKISKAAVIPCNDLRSSSASRSDRLSPPDSGLYDGRVQTDKNVIGG